jgi:hypothetical protein
MESHKCMAPPAMSRVAGTQPTRLRAHTAVPPSPRPYPLTRSALRKSRAPPMARPFALIMLQHVVLCCIGRAPRMARPFALPTSFRYGARGVVVPRESRLPHLHRDWRRTAHICTGRGRSTDVGPNTVPLQGVLVASSEDTCRVYASPSLEHTPWTHNGRQQPTTSSECHLLRGQRRLRSRARARQCSAVQCRLRFAARSWLCRCDGGAIW